MTVPLPGLGSNNWYSHYTRLDTLSRASVVANLNRTAFIGDSLTSLYGTGDNVSTFETNFDNYSGLMPVLSGGRMQYARAFATNGLTMAQIRSTVLPRLLAQPVAQQPGTCVVFGGINDAGAVSLTTSMAALAGIVSDLRNAEIRPVLCTIPPRGDSTSVNQAATLLNAAIAGYARQQGLPLLNFHSVLVDPATGGFASGMGLGDGVHPSPTGMMAMAQLAVDSGLISSLPPWYPNLIRTAVDSADLNAGNGMFLADTNADGVGDNWTAAATGGTATYTPSIVGPGGENPGNWQRITRTVGGEAGTVILQRYIALSGLASTNDLIALTMRVRWSGLSGGYTIGGSVPYVSLQLVNSGLTAVDATSWGSGRDITGVLHLERRVTATTAHLSLAVNVVPQSAGTPVVDVGQVTVRNLTTLGLA